MTKAHINAVNWLRLHGGDGLFDRDGVLVAAGERAPFMRSTWNHLRDVGYVEFYKPTGSGRGRVRLTDNAATVPNVPASEIEALQSFMAPE